MNKNLNKTKNNKDFTNKGFLKEKNVTVYQEIDEESDGMFGDMVKQRSMSKSFRTRDRFCAILEEAVSKIEIPKNFDKLDVVIGSKENHFSVNCTNYFSRLIKPLNKYCSFNFY